MDILKVYISIYKNINQMCIRESREKNYLL